MRSPVPAHAHAGQLLGDDVAQPIEELERRHGIRAAQLGEQRIRIREVEHSLRVEHGDQVFHGAGILGAVLPCGQPSRRDFFG